MALFLQSTKDPEIRFEVLSYDPNTKRGQIKSLRSGTVFEDSLEKEALVKLGYRIENAPEATQGG